MAYNSDFRTVEGQQGFGGYDAGLRSYMLRVYNWMVLGLVLTSAVAYAVVNTPLRGLFFHVVQSSDGHLVLSNTLLGMLGIFAPLAFVLVLSFGVNRLSRQSVQILFVLFSAAMGVSLSTLLLTYTGVSVVRTFLITALLYACMSLWGYMTKRSLSGFGSFLFMGLIGLCIAGFVNIFFPSGMMTAVISFVGVLVFTGFTAYDTQRIKMNYQGYLSYGSADDALKFSIYDALSMYLNFVNLFQFLLQFTGSRSGNSD